MLPPILILGIFVSIGGLLSSTNWPTIWCFFELNMMLFILLLILDSTSSKSSATTTYFLAQALGSTLLLLGAFMLSFHSYHQLFQYAIYFLTTTGILVKTASAPFQQWFVIMMPHINWTSIFFLSSVQKLGPLFILSNILISTNYMITTMYMFISLNLMIGALGMMNAPSLKVLLAYSSVHHLGWILSALSANTPMSAHIYIILYLLTLTPLMLLLNHLSATSPSTLFTLSRASPSSPWLLILLLLTLTGLPPFPLFFGKLAVLSLVAATTPLLIFLMLITTALSSYSYLQFLLSAPLTFTKQLDPLL